MLVAAYRRLDRHASSSLAGGLAFGALLSVAPLGIVVIAVASTLLGEGAARSEALALVADTFGPRAQPMVAEWIDQARRWSTGATIVGAVFFFYGGARLVGLIDEAFEIVFEVPPRRAEPTSRAIRRWITSQATTVVVSFGAGVVMAASLVLRTVGAGLARWIDDPAWSLSMRVVQELISLGLWVAALAVLYRALPPVRLSRGDVLRGAVVSALLLEATLLALRAFASRLELGAAYGAAGAVVATLLTLYVAGQLFLFGAEITAELAERRDGAPIDRLTVARAACTDRPMATGPDRSARHA